MKLNASIACVGLLASLTAGGMPQAVAGSIGIQTGTLSATGNNAPFAVENISSLSPTGGTINSNGYNITVSNVSTPGSFAVKSGPKFGSASSDYILMNGSPGLLAQPAFKMVYPVYHPHFSNTIFDFLWSSPQPTYAYLEFNSLSSSSTSKVFASEFANKGAPEWVSITNLMPFNTVNVVGFFGETDQFVPGVLVPEPSSLCILGSALLVLGFIMRASRRRDRSSPMSGALPPTTPNTPLWGNDKSDSVLVD